MRSLQRRLALWLTGSVLLVFAIHWPAATYVPRLIAREFIAAHLAHDADVLISELLIDEAGRAFLEPHFAIPAYEVPLSGHYYTIATPVSRLRSRSLWDEDLASPVAPGNGTPLVMRQTGPRDQPVLVWTRTFELAGHSIQVVVAEELTGIEDQVRSLYLRIGVVTLALLGVLLLMQGLLVRWTLRPLDRVREDCRRLAAGEVDRLSEDVPTEVQPLVEEVNHLLQVMGQRASRSRLALANLAHAVKTPLTVLTQALGDAQDRAATNEVRHALERIHGAVTRELRLARLAGPSLGRPGFDAAAEVPALIGVLQQAYRGRQLSFEAEGLRPTAYRGDREDMLELLGNLLDNAAKWARSRVCLELAPGPGLCFAVSDDGPGVPEEGREQVTERGVRLDRSVQGHGIGLAVCREIVEQYGGTLALSRSARLGGLRVEVRLPPDL